MTIITPGDDGTLVVGDDGNGFVIIDGIAYPVTVDPDDGEGGGAGFPIELSIEADGSLSNIDFNSIYVITCASDTLYNGHSKTYLKDTKLLSLHFNYDISTIAQHAILAIHCPTTFNANDYYWTVNQSWRDSLKTNNIIWKEGGHTNTGISSALLLDDEGSYDVSVSPHGFFDLYLSYRHKTDSLLRGDTLIKASLFDDFLELQIRINVRDSGILNFRPNNENHYLSYGFDDALSFNNQQSNDYGAPLNIGGADYYVSWMGVLPNQEATISLQYLSASPQMDSLIVLEASSSFVEILNFNENGEPAFNNETLMLTVTREGEYHINAYSISKGGVPTFIGKLNIECKKFDEDKIKRIKFIRLCRSDETECFPLSPTQKQEIVELINSYYKQAFLEFHLFDEGYQDILSVPFSTNDSILPQDFHTIDALIPNKVANAFYVLIVSAGPESYGGYGPAPGNTSLVFIGVGKQPTDETIDIVHELGHNLGLQHPFANNLDGKSGVLSHIGRSLSPPSTTRNLMDYSPANVQRRYFWLFQINFIKTK